MAELFSPHLLNFVMQVSLDTPQTIDREAWDARLLSDRHVETFDPTAEMEFGPASSEPVYTQEEEEQIKDRLRDLGYL